MPRPFFMDLILGAAAVVAVWYWLPIPTAATALVGYQVVATIASVVAAICSVALATQYVGRRARAFDEKRPGYLRRVYVMTMMAALVGAVLPVMSIFLVEKFDRLALAVAAGALSLTVTHSARLFWLFNSLLQLEEKDRRDKAKAAENKQAPPPKLAPGLAGNGK